MGINICVEKLDGSEHPDWDSVRHSGDSEVPNILLAMEHASQPEPLAWGETLQRHRPLDFSAFRSAAWPSVNQERWALLADILERDTDYWLHFSY